MYLKNSCSYPRLHCIYRYDYPLVKASPMRERGLALGISQISGGSRTSVVVQKKKPEDNSAQFDRSDTRTLEMKS